MALYLVTGGCGFIGSHLVEALYSKGHRVRVLDNLSTGKLSNVPSECEVVIGDVSDAAVVKSCFEGIDHCFHLAAISSVQLSNEDWCGTHIVNQTASLRVFEAARERSIPVVYASSAAVYGDNAETPLKETAVLRPITAYGADKLGTELHARVASLAHTVPTTGLRFFNVFGPRQDPSSPYSGVISIFVDRSLKQEPLCVYGDGNQVRDFVYVKDVVSFLLAAMQKVTVTPSVFNVCGGRPISINQLATTIMGIVGHRFPIEYLPSRQGDIRVSVGDPAYSCRHLNTRVSHSLSNGLMELISSQDMNGSTITIPPVKPVFSLCSQPETP